MGKINIVIVNNDTFVCNLLAVVLAQETDIKVIATVQDAAQAVALAAKCDIMLVDASLPEDGAMKLSIEVGRNRADTHVLITGVEKTPKTIIKYIEAGASGYILKEFSVAEMVEQIQSVSAGEAIADPQMVAELMERVSELADLCADQEALQKGVNTLSPRETEVLDSLSAGKSNAEIGEALHIEVGTVKSHVHSILKKLGVDNRHQAAQIHKQAEA